MNDKFFEGLKVLEFASVLAGPLVGSFFAELGADVIKVENPATGGDVTRKWKLKSENPEATVSAYYASANYGKKVHWADLTDDKQFGKLEEELKQAEIVIVNFKPGSAKKLGLDYESIAAINPSIIYASLSGYGESSNKVAFDMVLQAETGFLSMTGQADGPPCKIPVAMIDVMAAHHMKEAILCAMIKKIKTGKGSRIHISLEDAAIASLVNQGSNYLMAGKVAQRMGSLHPNIAPYGEVFTCSDGGGIMLAIGTDRQFARFCRLAGIGNESFKSNVDRLNNRDLLAKEIKEKFCQYPVDWWKQALEEQSIPFAEIQDLAQVFDSGRHDARILDSEIEGVKTRRCRTAYI